jgi:hypothetical protein
MTFIFGFILGALTLFAGIYIGKNDDIYQKISGFIPNFQSGPSEADLRKQILRELQEEEANEKVEE